MVVLPSHIPDFTYSLVPKERHERKKMARLENGLNIGDRAIGLGLNIKGMDILLAALKNIEIIQF